MKLFSILIVIFVSTSAFATGGFDCKSRDGSVTVSAIVSSAGGFITLAQVDGTDLVIKDEYGKAHLSPVAYAASTPATNPEFYLGQAFWGFKILDTDYNANLLQAEGLFGRDSKGIIYGEGIAWKNGDTSKIIDLQCSYSY